jgi:transcriptional regulator with GAF, ATPase, and Fis domain
MSAVLYPAGGAVCAAADDAPTTRRRPSEEIAVPVEVARDAPATTPVPGLGTVTSAGPLSLRLVDEDREVALDADPFTIGRDRRNHLVLADEGVSAFHCRIRRSGRRLLLEDRGSTNGTFLNDVRIFASELRVGGRLGVARRRLRLCGPAMAGPRPFSSPAATRYAIVGQDAAVVRLVERIERVAPTRATVLIVGESGSGKELVARALHVAGERPGGPFVVLNCATIARELAESELFGHERGAFTGAIARHRGVFEEAAGGTLFLDEVGELAPGLQAKLLRVLELGVLRPVGGTHEVQVAVRVVAATHRRLTDEIAAGRFRLDLYHRLAQVTLEVPPLRDRPSDLPLLCAHFLGEAAEEVGPRTLSPAALDLLRRAPWPGNIRELRHVLFRAALFSGPVVTAEDLCAALGADRTVSPPRGGGPLTVSLAGRSYDEIEREVYREVLRHHGGNRRAAAAALKLSKSTLCDRVRRLGLE